MNTEELLQVLACPRCLGSLTAVPQSQVPEGLACEKCGCVYPIREGIPVMLVEESIDRPSWDAGTRKKASK